MNKTKRKIIVLALLAAFVFSWGATYSPVRADGGVSVGSSGDPGDPTDGTDTKGSGGKGTKQQPPPPPKDWIEILMSILW